MCIVACATRKPIPKVCVGPQALHFGEEIHTDIWGPSPVTSRRGCRYFITFTDNATRYTVTYLLHTKAEALGAYKSFEVWALVQQHCMAIKVLRSDRRGKYLSDAFDRHLTMAGTVRRLTVHDTPQLNGVAERLCQEAALTRRTAWRCSEGGVGLGLSGKQLHPATPELTAWQERPADSLQ